MRRTCRPRARAAPRSAFARRTRRKETSCQHLAQSLGKLVEECVRARAAACGRERKLREEGQGEFPSQRRAGVARKEWTDRGAVRARIVAHVLHSPEHANPSRLRTANRPRNAPTRLV